KEQGEGGPAPDQEGGGDNPLREPHRRRAGDRAAEDGTRGGAGRSGARGSAERGELSAARTAKSSLRAQKQRSERQRVERRRWAVTRFRGRPYFLLGRFVDGGAGEVGEGADWSGDQAEDQCADSGALWARGCEKASEPRVLLSGRATGGRGTDNCAHAGADTHGNQG